MAKHKKSRKPKSLEVALELNRQQASRIRELETKVFELSETIKLLGVRIYGKKVKF